MSAPARQFQGLSIRGSAETETASRPTPGGARGGATTTMGRGKTIDTAAIEAPSGLVYDLDNSTFDVEMKSRALLGLTTHFDVLFCGLEGSGYEFVFAERVRVRIELQTHLDREKNMAGMNDAEDRYTCTCAVFRARADVACQHIFWLLDQLRGQFISASPPSPVLLTSDGHVQGFSRIEQLLSKDTMTMTLQDLAEELNWSYFRSVGKEGGMSRTQRVRDILSAFSTDVLPDRFRIDLAEPEDENGRVLQVRTPEQCVVQGDFEATLFRLAVHDDNVFTSLCKAMPPGACAAIYFDKVRERLRGALFRFDRYCQTLGQSKNDEGDPSACLGTVFETLQTDALNIHTNIHARAPHGLQGAAKALTYLLEEIATRNKDPLADNQYGRTAFSGEDEDSRNLYHQLVGKTDNDNNAGDYFVLNSLEDLAGEDLYPFKERLEAILHRVEVNRAPKGFILKLAGIVRAAKMGITRKRATRAGDGERDVERGRKRMR